MPTSRERVLTSLNYQIPDRVPKDLGGMLSTSISAFAYPGLVKALGLPPRLPRCYDTGQMLAMPDCDVLDALGIDVATVSHGVTNAFEQPDTWHPYDFGGRLPALVRNPARFSSEPDGTLLQGTSRMPPSSYVFDEPHGGQALNLNEELPRLDLAEHRRRQQARELTDERIVELTQLCRRAREATDRAIFFWDGALGSDICIHGYGGLAIFPILCLTDPDYVTELHEIATERAVRNVRALVPEIAPYVDIVGMASDDWGTQRSTIASPKTFRKLFLPYRRRINDEVHRWAPQLKTFLHSCGAIYDILDLIVESGFDVLNPVQWPAGGHTYQEWKDKARGRLTLWGGGVNSQHTLLLGSVDDVAREAREVTRYMAQDGGYVFCNIHNLLAEVPAEKTIAIYRAAESAL